MKWSLSWGLSSAFRSFKDLDDDDSGKLDPNEVGPWGFCWAMWGYSGWNLAEEWVLNGFLMILRDFHPMFFCWCFSTFLPHQSSTQHRSNFNKLVAFNTCDAGHEFADTFRLHYVRRVGGVNSSLMEFLKSGLLDGCYDILASLACSAVEECHWRRNSVRRRGRKRSHNGTVVYGGII